MSYDPEIEAALSGMSDQDVLNQVLERISKRKVYGYDPYPYQKEFHQAGKYYPERLMRAGNRLGKSYGACCEDTYHLTGDYPDWWDGKQFGRPTRGWIVSVTNETSRDILQQELLGNPIGTGLIPADRLVNVSYRQCGISNVVDTIDVRHKSGGLSTASFKVYTQGWQKFMGTAMDFIHMDEEPEDFKLYTECRTRIITRDGVIYSTITPLLGETDLMNRFSSYNDGCFMITASMLECPHLKGQVEEILATYPAYEREARLNGTPIIGEGRVFSYADHEILTAPIPIPDYWSRIAGIDFGINEEHQQAIAWLAHNRDTDTVYLYDEYKEPNRSYVQHAEALRQKGKWIPVAWPHDGVNRDKSGEVLYKQYVEREVSMLSMSARYDNKKGGKQSPEPAIGDVCERIESGRFKVFPQCRKFMDEFRSFHRKNGVIQAKKDDLIKAMLYGMMMLRYAAVDMPIRSQHRAGPAMRAWGNR